MYPSLWKHYWCWVNSLWCSGSKCNSCSHKCSHSTHLMWFKFNFGNHTEIKLLTSVSPHWPWLVSHEISLKSQIRKFKFQTILSQFIPGWFNDMLEFLSQISYKINFSLTQALLYGHEDPIGKSKLSINKQAKAINLYRVDSLFKCKTFSAHYRIDGSFKYFLHTIELMGNQNISELPVWMKPVFVITLTSHETYIWTSDLQCLGWGKKGQRVWYLHSLDLLPRYLCDVCILQWGQN